MNTKVTYLYRDASNYKFWNDFVVAGTFSRDMVTKYLIDNEFFVPSAIGLPALVPEVRNEDDHDWHTIEECEPTENGEALLTAKELVRRIRHANLRGWPIA